jgi:hypothetical protein
MICAIPRASLRSVLFGIAPIAALAWRVSMQIAANPASVRLRAEPRLTPRGNVWPVLLAGVRHFF